MSHTDTFRLATRAIWKIMPGGMPYYQTLDTPRPVPVIPFTNTMAKLAEESFNG